MDHINLRKNWHVLYTYSKREFVVEKQLKTHGVEYFLPMTKVVRQWSDRKKFISVPLLPNYVFVRLSKIEIGLVYNIVGITKILTQKDTRQPIVVPDSELDVLRNIFTKGAVIAPNFVKGEQVEIVRGPLKGIIGTIVKDSKPMKLVIHVNSISKSFTIEVDANNCVGISYK